MCTRETPAGERAMCGCYSRRAVGLGVGGAAAVAAAIVVPSFMMFAVVAVILAAAGIIGLAVSRQPGFGGLVHRYTPPVSPAVSARLTLEDTPDRWWERAQTGENGAQQ